MSRGTHYRSQEQHQSRHGEDKSLVGKMDVLFTKGYYHQKDEERQKDS